MRWRAEGHKMKTGSILSGVLVVALGVLLAGLIKFGAAYLWVTLGTKKS